MLFVEGEGQSGCQLRGKGEQDVSGGGGAIRILVGQRGC